MIMKSRICVNCMPAMVSKNRRSFLTTGEGDAECKDGLPVKILMGKWMLLFDAKNPVGIFMQFDKAGLMQPSV